MPTTDNQMSCVIRWTAGQLIRLQKPETKPDAE